MWGDGGAGKLGLGNHDTKTTPQKVPLPNVIAISLGDESAAAITSNGDLYTWGANDARQLGLPTTGANTTGGWSAPIKVAGISNVTAVSMGYRHCLAITSNGDLYVWGHNMSGALGTGDRGDTYIEAPQKLAGLSNITAICAGANRSAAITSGGDLYTWGDNLYGFIGHGTSGTTSTPQKVSGLSNLVDLAFGRYHSMAVTASGDLYTMGSSHDDALLGHGEENDSYTTPQKVASISNAVSVSAAMKYSMVLTGNGDLYAWGSGAGVGNGDQSWVINPVVVLSGVKVPGGGDGCATYATARAGSHSNAHSFDSTAQRRKRGVRRLQYQR